MGTIQKNFRKMLTLGTVIQMFGGKFKGKQITVGENFDQIFGKKGYSGQPRLMLTLPPVNTPMIRPEEMKIRKRTMRQAKRLRIDTRGY